MTSHAIRQDSEELRSFGLAVSRDFIEIRTKEALCKLIDVKLAAILCYEQATIYLINKENTLLVDFFADPLKNHPAKPFSTVISLDKNLAAGLPTNEGYDDAKNILAGDIWANDDTLSHLQPNAFPLFEGKAIVGYWVVYTTGNKTTAAKYQEQFKIVSNNISLVCLRLRLEETMVERENEAEIIQSFSTDFTTMKDRKDLLKVIHYKLRQLFDFGHQWVAVINDDQLTMTAFLREPQSSARDHPKYQQVIQTRYPINDNFLNKIILSKSPYVFDIRQISTRQALPEYLQVLLESGVNKIAMTGLHVGERILGVWAICLVQDQQLNNRNLQLIKGISHQLSIAVDNIIAYEAIKLKETETAKLLQLSYEISNVRTREDLVNVINNGVKGIFPFENIHLLLLNDDPQLNSYITASPLPSLIQPPHQSEWTDIKQIERIYNGFKLMEQSAGILILDIETFLKQENCSPYLKYEYQHGIKEKIMLALRDDSKILGLICVNTKEKGRYSEHSLELIKGVSYQISSAVSNILANEDILRRETERELLLTTSTDIAAVRSSNELLKVINNRFKNLLGFTHTVIGTIDEDQASVTPFVRDPDSKSRSHKAYEDAITAKYPIADSILNAALRSAKPVVINMVELAAQTELPMYLRVNYESGIKQAVVIRFSKGEDVHGFLVLFYDNLNTICKNNLSLVESLANQVSVAVLNIIANDDIQKREDEKTRLLAFSNALVSVRDKLILSKILKQQLKELFGITEYVIHALNADKTKHTPILFDPEAEFSRHPDFTKLLSRETDIHDGIFDVILASSDPVLFRIDDWTKLPNQPIYANAANAENLKTMVGVAIRFGNENIAVMNFKHDNYTFIQLNNRLFKSIISQVAVIISNIIANEKINDQLAEIKNYKLLLEEEKTYLKEEIEIAHNYAEIIGESASMQKVFRLMAQVAHADSTVLLLGETGTGKEIVARAIHNNSPRKNKLMVKVNCAALPVNLIESELFGHERGSFTGATERRLGKFELANGGTLFLDEIGEMPLNLQVKLLRALQEREIERIGGKGIIKVDVRIVAATNRDLELEMAEGRFRSDLYYRLNIFPIELPALRQRKEDIPLLATHFINRFGKKAGKKIKTISTRALQDMMLYNWPGNIRELEHLVERSILLTEGDMLKNVHLPAQKAVAAKQADPVAFEVRTIDDNERQHIIDTLKYCHGRVGGYSGAAELLGVPPSTLFSKMKKLHIKRDIISDNITQ